MFMRGVIYQFKICKTDEELRRKTEEARRCVEEDRGQLDLVVGREIEARTTRDRAQWEAVYGEKSAVKSHPDSSIGCSGGMAGYQGERHQAGQGASHLVTRPRRY